jgi:antitoxin (DNA-binding transcriptional repressor) of toxin-antitoxin stability system
MQTINITEARKRLPELVKKAYMDSKSFTITKGGIEMAKIVKAEEKTVNLKKKKFDIKKAIQEAKKIKGIWNDPEWKDKSSVEIVNYLRNKAWNSHAR